MGIEESPIDDSDEGREKLRLKVAQGNAAGTVIQVADELVIGRQATGEGTLGNDIEISRRHARIAKESEGSFLIEDLGSTNGTYVNGRRIESTTRLETGDRIEVGATALVVQVGAIPSTPAAGTEVPLQVGAEPPPADPQNGPGHPDAVLAADAPGDLPEVEEVEDAQPPPVSAPAPSRMSLRIELDLEAQKVTLSVDEHSEDIQLVLEDGRWRLAG